MLKVKIDYLNEKQILLLCFIDEINVTKMEVDVWSGLVCLMMMRVEILKLRSQQIIPLFIWLLLDMQE
jgi:hypothetical protein